MYDNSQGVASFYFPDDAKKYPLIAVIATQGYGIEISPFVIADEDCRVFNGEPEFSYWRGNLRTKDLTTREAGEIRLRALENILDRVQIDFKAITGNAKINRPEFKSMALFWRGTATDIEAELHAAGRLLVRAEAATPVFEHLRKMDSKGPAQTCYLQTLYLASKSELTAKSFAEREADYMRSVTEGTGAQTRTFRW